MEHSIRGLHHITAIAGNAQRNHEFYTKVLGVRLVKKTVNFDDPGTYHLYYGDEVGTPGSILTFFPWEGTRQGSTGTGMATEIGYSVPVGSLSFWKSRFEELNVKHEDMITRFGEKVLPFSDPDGLQLTLIESANADDRAPWTTTNVTEANATKGFHSIVLTVADVQPTASVITDIFGYTLQSREGNRYRYVTHATGHANVIDIVELKDGRRGMQGSGTNHHVAFRVSDDNILVQYHDRVRAKGFNITEKIDRNYFYSLYFREPGGVLFEIATDNPGFAVDEAVSELGTNLKLPSQYEMHRKQIEQVLPALS